MRRTLLAVVSLFAVTAACREDNPQSCERPENIGKGVCPDAATMGSHCSNDGDCTASAALGLPVCDKAQTPATCVQCTSDEHDLCKDTTPVCTSNRCAGCTMHADCPDAVCMPDGSCASAANVAYVDGDHGVDNAPCTRDAPCTKIDKAVMMKQIVKVSGTVSDPASLDNRMATILADPGAKLSPRIGDNGTLMEIKGGSKIAIYDLQISNATGPGITTANTADLTLTRVTVAENTTNGITVDDQSSLTCTKCLISANLGRGIDAAGGRLTISQSVIRDNMNGGIRAQDDTSFQIVGNIIYHNGLSTRTAAGGIFIQVNAPPADFVNQVDFNTLSANMGSDGGQGIQCMAVTSLTTSNNLIWDNGLTPAAAMQVFGSGCSYRYSDIGPMGIGTDNANMSMPPAFDSAPGKLLHLSTGSPVLGKADPTADLRGLAAFDVDGDPRVGPNVDIGADEMP